MTAAVPPRRAILNGEGMQDAELQRRLTEFGFYSGVIDGNLGRRSMQAISAMLNHGRVKVPQSWHRSRRVLAAKQLVCRREGIEVGAIDGLNGPQTEFALAVYAERRTGGPPAGLSDRDVDPPAAEPPGAPATWPRQADVETRFGPIAANQSRLLLPLPLKLAWDPSKAVKSLLIHEAVHDSARRCFERIADAYDEDARRRAGIDLFGGCFNVRKMRGGDRWSMHSWGIAIDFDPEHNGLRSTRSTARLAQPDCETFWRIWEDEGWISLGRTRDFDWMHVQAARL